MSILTFFCLILCFLDIIAQPHVKAGATTAAFPSRTPAVEPEQQCYRIALPNVEAQTG
jgi:hypothetical protein